MRFQFSAFQITKENLYSNLRDFRKDQQTLNKKITVFLMLWKFRTLPPMKRPKFLRFPIPRNTKVLQKHIFHTSVHLQLIATTSSSPCTPALTTQGAGARKLGIVTSSSPGPDEPFLIDIPKSIYSAMLIPSHGNYSKGFCIFSPCFLNLYQSGPFSHGLLGLFMCEKQTPL